MEKERKKKKKKIWSCDHYTEIFFKNPERGNASLVPAWVWDTEANESFPRASVNFDAVWRN